MVVKLANATWKPYKDLDGVPFDKRSGNVWKLLLHTTEGSTIAGAEATYGKYPPHLIYDPKTRALHQHVTLDKGSYALRRAESEDEPVIQVEIVGHAAETPTWTNEWIKNFAEDVAYPVWKHCPYEFKAPKFLGSQAYGSNSPTRMGGTEWTKYSGIVGHQHAPAPDKHWDPGEFRVQALIQELERLKAADKPKPPATKPKPPAKPSAPVLSPQEKAVEILHNTREIATVLKYTVNVNKLVDAMYLDILGRQRNATEIYWVEAIENGAAVYDVERFMEASDEAQQHARRTAKV